MPSWDLIVVTKDKEYRVAVGTDESGALRELAEARKHIGVTGTVTIAERLALRAEHIISVQIEEKPDSFVG